MMIMTYLVSAFGKGKIWSGEQFHIFSELSEIIFFLGKLPKMTVPEKSLLLAFIPKEKSFLLPSISKENAKQSILLHPPSLF